MRIDYSNSDKSVRLDRVKNRLVSRARRRKVPALKMDKRRYEVFPGGEILQPSFKFGQVIFLYRLSDQERYRLKVDSDNPGTIAVIP